MAEVADDIRKRVGTMVGKEVAAAIPDEDLPSLDKTMALCEYLASHAGDAIPGKSVDEWLAKVIEGVLKKSSANKGGVEIHLVDDSLAQPFSCANCGNLLASHAMLSPCGEAVCSDCARKITKDNFVCPKCGKDIEAITWNKEIIKAVKAMHVHCPAGVAARGNATSFQRASLVDLTVDANSMSIAAQDLQLPMDKLTALVERAKTDGKQFLWLNVEEVEEEIACDYECALSDAGKHVSESCPLRKESCGVEGCDYSAVVGKIEEHRKHCPHSKGTCPRCGAEVPLSELASHQVSCWEGVLKEEEAKAAEEALAAEEAARLAAEREEEERRAEEERLAREKAEAEAEAQRQAAEEAAAAAAKEREAEEERQRLEREAREEQERKEREEREERERKELEEREAREAREAKEREEKAQAEQARLEQERLEKERLEKERLENERLERERAEAEEAARMKQEQEERAQREREEQERREREEQEEQAKRERERERENERELEEQRSGEKETDAQLPAEQEVRPEVKPEVEPEVEKKPEAEDENGENDGNSENSENRENRENAEEQKPSEPVPENPSEIVPETPPEGSPENTPEETSAKASARAPAKASAKAAEETGQATDSIPLAEVEKKVKSKPKAAIYVDNPLVCQGSPHPFVAYSIHLLYNGRRTVIYRRMKDIKTLHKELHAECPATRLPSLPEDKWWFFGGNTKSFVEKRRAKLDRYFKALNGIPLVTKSTIWANFVTMKTEYKRSAMRLK